MSVSIVRQDSGLQSRHQPQDRGGTVLGRRRDDPGAYAVNSSGQFAGSAYGLLGVPHAGPLRQVTSIRELVVNSATFVARGSKVQCVFGIADGIAAVNAEVGQLSQLVGSPAADADAYYQSARPKAGGVYARRS